MRIEEKILANLIHNEKYCRKVAPFIDSSYFSERNEEIVSQEILGFFNKYNKLPTPDILSIELSNRTDIRDNELQNYIEYVNTLQEDDSDYNWLIDNTEKYCKDRAVYNAILKSISILDGKEASLTKDSIPSVLQTALSVSFDVNVGHDYLEDGDTRYELYHLQEDKIPFDLDKLNEITDGGMSNKAIYIVLAGSGLGKSQFMCHVAASTLIQNKNVLYITLEMSEEKIAERIDANLMNINIDQLKHLDKSDFDNRLQRISKKTHGSLVIKEYPTASVHSGHFRALFEELKVKKDFVPNLLIVDYLNICNSARIRSGLNTNSYGLIKAIAEELRGLGVEYNIPVLTASQLTRSAQTSSDVEITDISDSIGTMYIADFVIALTRSEELDRLNQIAVKQIKNRYSDPSKNRRFILGVDRAKMKFYNVEDSAQGNITPDVADTFAASSSFTPKSQSFNEFLF